MAIEFKKKKDREKERYVFLRFRNIFIFVDYCIISCIFLSFTNIKYLEIIFLNITVGLWNQLHIILGLDNDDYPTLWNVEQNQL